MQSFWVMSPSYAQWHKRRDSCLGHQTAPCSPGLLSLSLHDGVGLEEEGERKQERRERERQDKGRRGKREKRGKGRKGTGVGRTGRGAGRAAEGVS